MTHEERIKRSNERIAQADEQIAKNSNTLKAGRKLLDRLNKKEGARND